MAIWFNWSPVAPLIESYVDDGTRDLCTADISIENIGNFKVSLVGTKHQVELIRVATLNSDGQLSPKQSETVGKLIDHMIAVLKLTHNAATDLVRWGENAISLGAHDVDGRPNLNVRINELIGAQPEVAADNIRNVLVASMGHRALFKLLADAQLPLLPLQYRYLSLYKVLELEFRSGRQWSSLEKFLESYEHEYKALNISARSMRNIIHEMRDKCAHIKAAQTMSWGLSVWMGRMRRSLRGSCRSCAG